ncbi:MAG TPA: MFS transporter [Candidatus Paceibacterota bacterium]|nr:MFS transporter [Candidatus Paceibacterota bacterium]
MLFSPKAFYDKVNNNLLFPENKRVVLYFLSFLIALHNTPAIFMNSNMIEQFVGNKNVGYIFALSSILSLFILIKIKGFLQKIGNYKTFVTALTVDFVCLGITSLSLFFNNYYFGIIFITAYIIGHMARIAIVFSMDIFLENHSTDSQTGGIRGKLLTAVNFSFIIGPLLASFVVTDVSNAGIVYVWGMTLLIPIFFIARKNFRNYLDSKYEKNSIMATTLKVLWNRNIYNICKTNFALSLFYSWMIIYTPIFLRNIGFDLGQISMIIGFALIPFVLLQIPLGKIADEKYGEKEIMIIGFSIMAIATATMSFVSSQSIFVWILILFMTRVGASMVEVMNETYLFKKINDSNIDIISTYRSIEGIAYIIGPILASILLIFVKIEFIFLILAFIVLNGIRYALKIRDSR